MNTKILTYGLIILGLFGLTGLVTATTVTDGNDNVIFDGETITIANWANCSNGATHTYLWVVNDTNKTQAFIGGSNGATGIISSGSDIYNNIITPCSYTLNTSKNLTQLSALGLGGLITYDLYVVNSWSGTSPTIDTSTLNPDTSFKVNNFTISITPDYTVLGVINGDNATLNITTTGASIATLRATAAFGVVTTESGVTPVRVVNDTDTGTVMYKIPVGTVANNSRTVTVSDGGVQRTGYYAVRALKLLAYDRTASTVAANKVILKTVNETGGEANYTSSMASGSLSFNLTISGRTNDYWTGAAGNYTITAFLVNVTNKTVVADNLTTGSTAGTGTITATCLNFTAIASATYTVHTLGENITIANTYMNGTATSTFYVPQNITVAGWVGNTSETVNLIVAMTDGTIIFSTNGTTPQADGTWNYTWNPRNNTGYGNWTLLSWTTPAIILPLGTYNVKAWVNGSAAASENATTTITVADTLTIGSAVSTHDTTVLTDEVYIDDILNITGASTRVIGDTVLMNITGGTKGYVNSSISATVTGAVMSLAGSNGTYTQRWNTSDIFAKMNSTGTYTIFMTNRVVNATKTVTVKDDLTVTAPATGPVASAVNITGVSSRANGTTLYIAVFSGSPSGITVLSGNTSTVSGYKWAFNWGTYLNGDNQQLPLASDVTYYIVVNDSVTSATAAILLGTGSLNIALNKSSMFLDDTVGITGTTTLPAGTTVSINVTSDATCSGKTIAMLSTTVNGSQIINTTWTPSNNAAGLKTNASLVAGTPVTLCIKANATSGSTTVASNTASISVSDNLALTTVNAAVSGDNVMLTGTSSRANGTTITINVTGSNYVQTKSNTTAGQNTVYTTGTFSESTYYATVSGASGGTVLPAGTYTITATDGTVSVSKTLTIVSNGVIAITKPTTSGVLVSITGGNVVVEGTSNRASSTAINITVSGLNSSTVNTAVNTSGGFNATWDTSGILSGYYTLNAQVYGKTESNAVTIYYTTTTLSTTTTVSTTTTTTSSTTTTIAPAGTVVINEFLSSAGALYSEWIELYNKGGVAVDLTGWTIANHATTNNLTGTIAAGGYKILNQSTDITLSLSDSGDVIILKNASGSIIDQVAFGDYNDGNVADNAYAEPYSSQQNTTGRYPNGADTNVDNVDFSELIATPGASNGPTTTTTTTTTIGTTTTTMPGCVLVGNGAPCNEVSVAEIIASITSWSSGGTTMEQVLALINAWATSTGS